jgi:hypothetical protein
MSSLFLILRTNKLKTPAKIAAADKYNLRFLQPANTDPRGEHYRVYGDRGALAAHKYLLKELDFKPCLKLVPALEYIATYSPDSEVPLNITRIGRKHALRAGVVA